MIRWFFPGGQVYPAADVSQSPLLFPSMDECCLRRIDGGMIEEQRGRKLNFQAPPQQLPCSPNRPRQYVPCSFFEEWSRNGWNFDVPLHVHLR